MQDGVGPKRIRSLDRGLSVVEHLSRNGVSSLAELRRATGLSNATLLRLLSTLQDRGWIRRNIVEGQYELAHSLGKLLGETARAHPLAEVAAPVLLDMKTRLLGFPSDLSAIIAPGKIEIIESTRLRGPLAPGRTGLGIRPSILFSAHGRAILPHLSNEEFDAHISALEKSSSKKDRQYLESGRLPEELERTKSQGFGLREDNYWEESGFDPGPVLGAIAVPIISTLGIHGALSVLWLKDDMTLDEVLSFGALEHLATASAQIGVRLTKAKLRPTHVLEK